MSFKEVRKLADGRYSVVRDDGATLSMTVDDWQDAIEDIEELEFGPEAPRVPPAHLAPIVIEPPLHHRFSMPACDACGEYHGRRPCPHKQQSRGVYE